MSKLAIELIRKCRETKSTYLDLGKCGLTDKDFVQGSPLDLELRKCAENLETLVLSNEWYQSGEFEWDEWGKEEEIKSNNVGPDNFFGTYPKGILELSNLSTLIMGGTKKKRWNISDISFLSSLPNLRSLSLCFNKIRDDSTRSIEKLLNLTYLDVRSNSFLGEKTASAIAKLSNLVHLDIRENYFDAKSALAIAELPNLTKLNIGQNRLGDMGAEAISNLINLIYLDIHFNLLTKKGAEDISKLANLKYLRINHNDSAFQGAEAIANLINLNYLGFNNSHINDHGATALSKLINLTHLDIGSNDITDKGTEFIAKLRNLTHLDIAYNRLTETGVAAITRLEKLTHLKISEIQLTEVNKESIGRLRNLSSLEIFNCQISDKAAHGIAELANLTNLCLVGSEITNGGVEAISKLKNLTSIDLTLCQITDNGAKAISRLKNVNYLQIGQNHLTDEGAEAVGKMVKLSNLNITGNQLTHNGAEAISRLSNLKKLGISSNDLSDRGAEAISKLTNLTDLYFGGNQLTDKGLEAFTNLSNLIYLDVRANNITKINSIEKIVSSLENLSHFEFDLNRIEGLPKEIGNNITALRAFFRSKIKVPNTLVKMILIGNTTAGKSSLAEYLVNKKFHLDTKRTHGIQLWRWKTGEDDNALQVNIWDFGGQDYYHATHNLFLDDKALFLLLHSTRETHVLNADQKQYLPQNYWLGNIRNMTDAESSIWYIQSKSENTLLQFLDSGLQQKYNVTHQFKISVKQVAEGLDSSKLEFEYFLHELEKELASFAKNELPASWVIIRDKFLPKWRQNELYLSTEAFREKCEQALTNESDLSGDLSATWDGLIPYLKGCGEIVYFSNDTLLRDKVFLSAEKLTNGIYDVLSEKVLENKGEFTLEDLEQSAGENAELFLNVLLAFKIVFEKPGRHGVYVAPQYLPENPHTIHFQHLIKIAYVIQFPDYMSRSLITKFLVEYAGLEAESFYWRYGAFFKKYGLNVFVRIDVDSQRVYVHVEDGQNRSKFDIMKELFLFFCLPDKLKLPVSEFTDTKIIEDEDWQKTTEIQNNKAVQRVPGDLELSVNDKDFISIKDLREALTYNTYKVRSKQGRYIEFNAVLHQLLNTNSTMPKKIFLSYSHKDEEYKEELDTHFAALKRSGKVETWQDRKILPGEDWDKSIEIALLDADIALLLLSPDFMASDYIWNVEIPKAIEKGVTIVPIFLRPCDFKESVFDLHKKQGLPKDADWIVSNKFKYRDEAYLEVINGIKKLLDN